MTFARDILALRGQSTVQEMCADTEVSQTEGGGHDESGGDLQGLQASWRTYDNHEMCVSLGLGTYSTAGTEPHSCICFSFHFDHYEVVGICTVK